MILFFSLSFAASALSRLELTDPRVWVCVRATGLDCGTVDLNFRLRPQSTWGRIIEAFIRHHDIPSYIGVELWYYNRVADCIEILNPMSYVVWLYEGPTPIEVTAVPIF